MLPLNQKKDHELFSATHILCSKKIGNKKIEGSPLLDFTNTNRYRQQKFYVQERKHTYKANEWV